MPKNQITKIIILSIAALGLAAATILLPQRQLVKKKAAFGNVNLRLVPATATKNVNEEFIVLVKIEAGNYEISGADLKLNYDKTKLTIVGFTHNSGAFDNNLTTDLGATTGVARLVVLNVSKATLPTGTFNIGQLRVKGLTASGATPVSLVINKAGSTVVGKNPSSNDVVLNIVSTTDGAYTFVAGGAPTATPTVPGGRVQCNGSCAGVGALCASGLTCIESTKLCRNSNCPTRTDCTCPGGPTATLTPTVPAGACQPVGKVINVTPVGGAGTCHDIQQAVNAVAGEGYTIKLAAGEYVVPNRDDFSVKVIGKANLTIEGNINDFDSVKVRFPSTRGGFYFENSSGSLKGAEITGGTTNGIVYLKDSRDFTLMKNRITDETANAVQINGSQEIIVQKCTVKSSSVAIYPSNSRDLLITGNTVTGNIGIQINHSSGTISYNLFMFLQESYIRINDNDSVFGIKHNTLAGSSDLNADGAIINKASRFTDNIVANTGKVEKCGLKIIDGNNEDFTGGKIAHNDFFNVGRIFCSPNCPAGQCTFTSGNNGNISADPLFGDDYCLKTGSPAIYGDPAKKEYMGHKGPCLGPSGTPPPGGWPILNFKVKFQGVTSKRADQKVRIVVKKAGVDKTFNNVNVVADDNGIYSGSVTLTDVPAGDNYRISIKGPKHLSRKFCENNQAVRCTTAGKITLAGRANTFDFSKIVLEAGDLPDPNNGGKQDGVVNSIDYSLWKARIGKEDADSLAVADVNFDGIVNFSGDWMLIRNTLETKYEEEE